MYTHTYTQDSVLHTVWYVLWPLTQSPEVVLSKEGKLPKSFRQHGLQRKQPEEKPL